MSFKSEQCANMDAGRCQEVDYDEQGYRLKEEVMNCIEETAVDYHEQSDRLENGVTNRMAVSRVSCDDRNRTRFCYDSCE